MKKNCKVIILPTNNIPTNGIQPMNYYSGVGKVRLGVPTTGAEACRMQQNGCQAFHLYIISDDEIQVGDWVYNEKGIVNANHAFLADLANMFRSNKKIIASTDLSLGLPSIPKDFIEKYCEAGGIDEVRVEYEHYHFDGDNLLWKPKVSSDNTITIRPVKQTWTRDEVINLISGFHLACLLNDLDVNERNVWIEKNL